MSEIVAKDIATLKAIKLQEHRKKFYLNHIDRIKVEQKRYRDNNKETVTVGKHTYYVENKDAINELQATKFECACGGRYTRSNKSKHEKSNIHIRSLEINEIIN